MRPYSAWMKLWDMATSEAGGPATITVDPEDAERIVLTWPDGSRAALRWHAGTEGWEFVGSLDGAPCDVAARDSL